MWGSDADGEASGKGTSYPRTDPEFESYLGRIFQGTRATSLAYPVSCPDTDNWNQRLAGKPWRTTDQRVQEPTDVA